MKTFGLDIFPESVTKINEGLMNTGGTRPLSAIKYIVIHGTATTNVQGAMDTWLVSTGKNTSANILITDTDVWGCVGLNYIAWHSGGTGKITNYNSIGIEHINSYISDYNNPNTYYFSDKTLENGAKTVADICKQLGLPPTRETIVPHREVSATACPQTLNIDNYVKKVQYYYYQKAEQTKEEEENTDMLLITFKDALDDFIKNGVYLFNFARGTYHHVKDAEELNFIKKQYPSVKYENASRQYPCHIRYINGFKMTSLDKK